MENLTREYLEEALKLAKRDLPGWAYAMILREARARAGGRTSHKRDEPNMIEKLALSEIKPSALRNIDDKELGAIWLRLHQWYANAKKRNRATENIVNAALWVEDELKNREIKIGETELSPEIDKLRSVRKESGIVGVVEKAPKELVVVRDFVSLVGSAAKGKKKPVDIDVLVRAPFKDDQIHIQSENIWLPIRNVLDTKKEDRLHFINNPQGAHGDYMPIYDLVLRRHDKLGTQVVKSEVKIDLGCGETKPDGYIGIDKVANDAVDTLHDLEHGIPLDSESVSEIRAMHVLEHLSDKEKIMAEIHRVLKPGGRFVFEVPSTRGEGAFAHPDHKSWWNKSSFHFWTQDELCDDRPQFEIEKLEERIENEKLVYVVGALKKPATINKAAFEPFTKFIPPKPRVAGFTELFDIGELWAWAEKRLPIAVEPKWNGFRAIIEKKGDKQKLWFEGTPDRDRLKALPVIAEQLQDIDQDFILDVDVAIEKNGKRLPRPQLMKLNADEPEFETGEETVVTVFDGPYLGEDLTKTDFATRRRALEKFFKSRLSKKQSFRLSPIKWASAKGEASLAAKWAFGQDKSEGLMAKSGRGQYALDGTTNEWSKLKRVAELKVIVLDVKETKAGAYNYLGGLIPSKGAPWTNITKFKDKEYVNLGKSFSTSISARPGDILTVEVLELIPNEEKKKLSWLGARVMDVDKTRTKPYTTGQSIDISRRAKVLQKALDVVPTLGPKNASVAFIGASPGKEEVVRGEPFVGPAGQTFNEFYLKPLGLKRHEVALTNAVPRLLTDRQGRTREPNNKEVGEWKKWLSSELDELNPSIVVALGKVAKKALGDRAFVTLPHPSAVRRFGERAKTDEMSRKLNSIQRRLGEVKKQADEEGATSSDVAFSNWEKNWHEMLPTSGKGRFVYQQHFIGLDDDEAKLNQKELLDTQNALHGDIRLESDDALWGWAVFLGKPADNKKVGGDKLFAIDKIDKLQAAPKLSQPKEWLGIGTKKPHVAKPGEPGAFARSNAKFFAMDEGTYQLGVARKHGVEIFLDGRHLKGRYLLQFAPIGEKRIWLIDKPEDQTPIAEKQKLADLLSELRRKRQKFLIWSKPGEKPQKIDVKTGRIVKELVAPIVKADEEKQIVYGVVLDPYQVDAHKDWIPPEEIEKTAHDWFKESRQIGVGHPGLPGYDPEVDSVAVESSIVEYPSRSDYLKAMRGEPHKAFRRKYGSDYVHSGAWIIGAQLGDKSWKEFKDGDINAYSVEGFGVRDENVTRSVMPDVTFVDVVIRQ